MGFLGISAALPAALWALFFPGPSLAADSSPEVCKARDEMAVLATLDSYFNDNLKEHQRQGFARALQSTARSKAKAFLDQKILDKRAEFCADRLKLAEDIKAAPAKYTDSACAGAAVVGLLDRYTTKVAATFDENRKMLGALHDAHVHDIKLKLFDIAKGSTVGLEGSFGGYPLVSAPKKVKFEWLKQEASKLGGEAHLVWGAVNAEKNPLVQENLQLAREAVKAKQERDSAKARFHTDGKPGANCKAK
ncbi:MAG TPA: hypothetical protein VIH99_01490 [Bdellovibrionota bacterium]|jgi:hypothetical protein